MHWFWRAAIATAVSLVYAWIVLILQVSVFVPLIDWIMRAVFGRSTTGPDDWQTVFVVTVLYFLPTVVLAFVAYATLTRWLGPSVPDHSETRCRKCGYILRGISEPRCPECGEKI